MKIVVENSSLRKRDWQQSLDISEDEWIALLEAGLLVADRNMQHSMCFVGLAATETQLIAVVPKFFAEQQREIHASEVWRTVAALRAYANERKQGSVTTTDQYELFFNSEHTLTEHELYITLLHWYRNHGGYVVTRRNRSTSHFGRINWPKTIATQTPVHSGTGVIYPHPISHAPKRATNDITTIQLSVLLHLHTKYAAANADHYALPDEVKSGATITPKELVAQSDSLRRRVERELSQVFRSDTLALLRNLRAFFDLSEQLSGPRALQLFGTTAFHTVWERACAFTFRNSETDFAYGLSQPTWYFSEPNATVRPGGKQRPDIATPAGTDTLAILDAKYYSPLPDALCGWSDLVKQFFYAQSCNVSGDVSLLNGLIFPTLLEDSPLLRGRVLLEDSDQPDPRFDALYVFSVNATQLLSAYIDGTPRSDWLPQLCEMAQSND